MTIIIEIVDKTMIKEWILPHLTVGTCGFDPTVPLTEIVEYIFHRLKTGCPWRELPTKQFFTDKILYCIGGQVAFGLLLLQQVEQSRLLA